MDADIHTLYTSDYYRIMDFRCRCTDCRTSKPEQSDRFCISFVRKGNFLFNVFRNSLDSYSGCILITKPEYERTVTHTHAVPDECTIFEISPELLRQLKEQYVHTKFFRDPDLHSTLIRTNPETEFLHFYITQLVLTRTGSKLHIDQLIFDMIRKVLNSITDYEPDERIHTKLKKNHLTTIERAKEYLTQHFMEDISLKEIAEYSYVSPFHFSRIFKTFTAYSPYQFLQDIRLQHAALLLENTPTPLSDVAYTSGFMSMEYFNAAFRKKFELPPAKYRHEKMSRIS